MTSFICRYCNSERKNDNSFRNHERCCPNNPNRNYTNGMLGKKGSNQFIKAKELGLPTPYHPPNYSFLGKTHSEETKKKISEKLSLNNKGGKTKWYEVNGIKVQGTWERNVAQFMTENKIDWIKPTTNTHSFRYEMDGVKKTYTPDFFLIDYNIYLEIKGYWWGKDKDKMKCVLEQHPTANIKVIEKEDYYKILNGELVW